ncbi:hypothetical protein AV530_000667 [Patagioenas fasciata monilis]|uniref:Uncharacterized protein n=1 Tax=Patagioenas fasciata monilis TaxID=372326 RepID=A0A1V4IGF7_PATFA|nr:hypothetical protein AV530_000667 [Patagioenas fasciata monilis]
MKHRAVCQGWNTPMSSLLKSCWARIKRGVHRKIRLKYRESRIIQFVAMQCVQNVRAVSLDGMKTPLIFFNLKSQRIPLTLSSSSLLDPDKQAVFCDKCLPKAFLPRTAR